ncbi:MAG: hypothetical protein ABI597_08620 [Gammaproteobacteria bacterium]
MTTKTCTIYFALHPPTERVIPIEEQEKYLSCKFWKISKQEADLFYYTYPASIHGEFYRVVGILSCRIFEKKDIMQAWQQIQRLIDLYRFGNKRVQYHISKLPKYKTILDGITSDTTYPKNYLIDDVLTWAAQKQIITTSSLKLISNKIELTREIPFNKHNNTNEFRIEIIKLLVEHNQSLLYEDAKALLFPEQDLFARLSNATNDGKIIAAHSINMDKYDFDTRSLIKWLIQNEFLSKEITAEFPTLEVEAIKESIVKYRGSLDSLSKLVSQGKDRNDLLSKAENHEYKIYLKYPRKYLRWREKWKEMLLAVGTNYFAEQRYDGFGQLKIFHTDDTFRCQFGGLTIDMLLHNEEPEYCTSKPAYEIEFVPTSREFDLGLQPYIEIPSNKINDLISDNNLIFIEKNESNKTSIENFSALEKMQPRNSGLQFNDISVSEDSDHCFTFNKRGKCYEIKYFSDKIILEYSKGLAYIEQLIKRPKKEIHANELEFLVNKSPQLDDTAISAQELEDNSMTIDGNTNLDVLADEKTIRDVKAAIKNLDEQIEEANQAGCLAELEKLQENKEKFVQYLGSVTGLHYKPRKTLNQQDRTRKRVGAAISRAISIIKPYSPDLHIHLSSAIHTGLYCEYKPNEQVDWR